ncbi:hypothetical protein [Actinomadura opuntiae]|uniref:hypothetical protein n=1 Tax=Actinomadura sp. OS1-43 TaxID=604315 RepID=UPI00255B1378|nr:hypothetical protein [Actinomadura sp. OS1-43]MDL4815220.1 hypothetical protein [Actinomadura sp. OS1-43]
MNSADGRCPLCTVPVDATAVNDAAARRDVRCAVCGWTLAGPWRPGRADRAAAEAALSEARLEFDLRAAARAGDDWLPYASHLRGRPSETQWQAARRTAAAGREAVRPPLAAVLDALGPHRALVVVAVEDAGVRLFVTGGVPAAGPLGFRELASVPWPGLLPGLARDAVRRRFQLAGGPSGIDPAWADATIGGAVGDLVRRYCTSVDTAVMTAMPGMPFPDAVVRAFTDLLPDVRIAAGPDAGDGDAAALLGRIVAERPIARPYGLAALRARPADGSAEVVRLPLFPAGARAGDETAVRVRRVPGVPDQKTALAVVTWDDPPEPIRIVSARMPRGASGMVRVALDGPGRVRFLEPDDVSDDAPSWPELLRRVPARLPATAFTTELVCVLELGGRPETARRRRDLVADLLELLGDELGGTARVAVVGHLDHPIEPKHKDRDVVFGGPLQPPDDAARTLADLPSPPSERFGPRAAPLEDSLDRAAALLAGPRDGRARVLLTVAGRPPHPGSGHGDVLRPVEPCPRRLSWRHAVARMEAAGVRLVAVTDAPAPRDAPGPHAAPGRGRGDAPEWEVLGAAHRTGLDSVDAAALAKILGVLPGDDAPPLPFPLVP